MTFLEGFQDLVDPFLDEGHHRGNGDGGDHMHGVDALDLVLLDELCIDQVFQDPVEDLRLLAVVQETFSKIPEGG